MKGGNFAKHIFAKCPKNKINLKIKNLFDDQNGIGHVLKTSILNTSNHGMCGS